ncbi:MAG TPA: hypothetical protein VGY99_00220, partial [Candidatus Binataceae bacterium]|nr:hypothetical protein [Candidatus Binataceae bacterium]
MAINGNGKNREVLFDPAEFETQPNGVVAGQHDGHNQVDDDPFNPENLRLSQDFGAELGVKKLLTTVKARKPDKSWFVRVHRDEAYRVLTTTLEIKGDNETYVIVPSLAQQLLTE